MSGILMMSVGNSYSSLPVNTVAPAVTGTASVGQTLTTTNGTWTGAPAPTFTYQWQRNSSNISGATSSTYVLDFPDASKAIRCVVTATNSLGAVSANSNSTASVSLPAIGSAAGGGFYAGSISTSENNVATHYLIVGPVSTAVSLLQWKDSANANAGATSFINGPQNTADLVADGNATVYPAAHFCNNLVTGGQTDWYMPARNELITCYYFLKPTTQTNTTSQGSNPNAVSPQPSTTNYSSGSPAQTSAAAFQEGGAQAFTTVEPWWSSTRESDTSAFLFRFTNGSYDPNFKSNARSVRAIRRVAV